MMRRTSGSVRSASATVKYLGMSLGDEYSLDFFGVRNEADDSTLLVDYHDGGPDMMVLGVQLLVELVSLQLLIRLHDGRISAHVVLGVALLGVVAYRHTADHDVSIRHCSQIAPVLRIVDHRHHRNVARAHEGGDFCRRGAGGGDERISDHDGRCQHVSSRKTGP